MLGLLLRNAEPKEGTSLTSYTTGLLSLATVKTPDISLAFTMTSMTSADIKQRRVARVTKANAANQVKIGMWSVVTSKGVYEKVISAAAGNVNAGAAAGDGRSMRSQAASTASDCSGMQPNVSRGALPR